MVGSSWGDLGEGGPYMRVWVRKEVEGGDDESGGEEEAAYWVLW